MAARERTWQLGVPVGVDDSVLESAGAPGYVPFVLNGVITRRGVRVRPGILPPTTTVIPGSVDCQLVKEFTTAAGVLVIAYVYAGLIYVSTDGGFSNALYVTAANFASASITRTTSGVWYASVFNGTLIINDGTNRPFQWNGTSGASGLTSLTNAPATVIGPATTYYAKVFFLKDPFTAVWSEENDANTGYEAGGYNNTWRLSQNDSDRLYRLQGTNEGLYYFRRGSIGMVTGAVTPEFATTGVHDAITTTVGSVSLLDVVVGDTHLWFVDPTGRPWAVPRGGGAPVALWEQLRFLYGQEGGVAYPWYSLTFPSAPGVGNGQQELAYHGEFGLVAVTLSSTLSRSIALFDQRTLRCTGVWEWPLSSNSTQRLTSAFVMDDAGGSPLVAGLVLGGGGSAPGSLALTARADVFTTTQYPTFEVWGPATDPSSDTNHYFTELHVNTTASTDVSAPAEYTKVTMGYLTSTLPHRSQMPATQSVDVTRSVTGGSNDEAIVNRRAVVGLNGYGRWLVPKVHLRSYTGAGAEQAAAGVWFVGLTIKGYVADQET